MKTTAKPSTATTPRGQATRERLLEAALRLFGELGFEGASTYDVAREAGVSQGLIRFHFGSKEGLRTAVEERLFAAQYAALDDVPDVVRDGYFDALAVAWTGRVGGPAAVRLYQKYLIRTVLDESKAGERRRRNVVEFYEELVSRWRSSNRLRDDIDDVWAVVMLTSLVFGTYVLAPTFERELGVRFADPDIQTKRGQVLSKFMDHGLLKP